MTIPTNLKYTKDHEWVRIEEEIAYVGITDYAQGELGDIVFIEVETVDETLSFGEIFGTIEAVKTVSDLMMPVSGEILELNEQLDENPELINDDPYGKGWIIKVAITDLNDAELLTADEYKAFIDA